MTAILSAAQNPEESGDLLRRLAREPEREAAGVAVLWLATHTSLSPELAFYWATSAARHDRQADDLRETIRSVRLAAPDQVHRWTLEAAQLAAIDPRVLIVVGLLAEPLPEGVDSAD